jgi:hypothetical protein
LGIGLCLLGLVLQIIPLILMPLIHSIQTPIPIYNKPIRIHDNYNKETRDWLRGWNMLHLGVTVLFMVFTCGMLTFSNSYILAERQISMCCLAIACVGIATQYLTLAVRLTRQQQQQQRSVQSSASQGQAQAQTQQSCCFEAAGLFLVVAMCSRAHDLLPVRGHGMDPTLRMHMAHTVPMFGLSLVALMVVRVRLHMHRHVGNINQYRHHDHHDAVFQTLCDVVSLAALGVSWIQKRHYSSKDHNNDNAIGFDGFAMCRLVLWITAVSTIVMIVRQAILLGISSSYYKYRSTNNNRRRSKKHDNANDEHQIHNLATTPSLTLTSSSSTSLCMNNNNIRLLPVQIASKMLLLLMVVTGSSAASSAILFVVQLMAMWTLLSKRSSSSSSSRSRTRSYYPFEVSQTFAFTLNYALGQFLFGS